MTTISARTILRSRNTSAPDKVLSTLLLRYPRFIHAEFMTHRALSRNAASSRAIPVKTMIEDILADIAMPIHWGAAQKGMQAYQQCDNLVDFENRERSPQDAWRMACIHAINAARAYEAAGYHKQVINRLLEPFMHITVLVSATEWDNFLELRDHHAAEPHIQMLAREIRKCLENDPVQDLAPGQWHLPLTQGDADWQTNYGCDGVGPIITEDLKKLSVARCASTSYKTTDGFDMDMNRATAIYEKLFSKPFHASPFEHVAQADCFCTEAVDQWCNDEEHGNFIGFRQLRKQLENTL